MGSLLLHAACSRHAVRSSSRLDAAFHVADSLRLEGRSAQASPLLRALRDSFALVHDTAGLWRAELWWGDALLGGGHADSARVALDDALALAGSDLNREGWVRNQRSILFDRLGKFDSASAEAMRARQLARTTKDRALEANTFNAMGRIHSLTGHYRAAFDDNTQALAIKRAVDGDSSRGVATELNELGIDYRHLGRFTDAENALGQAIVLERARRNPEGMARVSFNLANVYVATGDDGRALPLMLDALRIVAPTGNVRGQVFLHSNLAELYTRAASYSTARAHIDSALVLNHGVVAYSRVELLGALGRLELAQERPGAAIVSLDSARRLADSAGFGRQRVSARASLARAAIALGDARAATRWAGGAVLIADSLDDPEAQVEAREANGAALEGAGRASALDEYRRTIALLESWRGRIALGDLRMGVAEPRLSAYEGAIRILIHAGRPAEAFDVAEHARARLLLDLMYDHDAHPTRSRGEDLRQRIRERFDVRNDVPAHERDAIDREVAALVDTLGGVERAAREQGPGYGVRDPVPVPIATVQTQVVTPGRAILAVFWGEHDVYGWWITRGAVRGARLGRADSLATIMEFLRSAINDTSGIVPWKAAARRAFATVVSPLAPDSASEVLVIADGPLVYVPLEVFIAPGDSVPWGATRRFVYGPSASVLAILARAPARGQWNRGVLAVGDPAFAVRDGESEAVGVRAHTRSPLPYAAGEARDIAKLVAGKRADVLVGREATLARWRALGPGQYRYLHFATHTALSGGRRGTAAVMLADGVLGLPEIRQLDLTAELVTLSGCETALGYEARGEGIVGLSHAFLAAGARGTVVTLWPIRDQSAADFMAAFYHELGTGAEPSAALLAVRRTWIASRGPKSHPSRWAAYVLVGGLGG